MFFYRKNTDQEPWVFRVFGASLGAVVLFLVEVAQIIILAAAIIIPVRYFLIQPFVVTGASMEPNFYDSEYLIIDEVSYRLRDIHRGEIVVFRPSNSPEQFYIKRVIGLPGETIQILEGEISIFNKEFPNGHALIEEYIEDYTNGQVRVTLGLDEYYVLGDNRDASLDSRKIGPVSAESIIGRVWLRGLPLDRLGTISSPEYTF
ncbi:MAG: signal peptidase I [Patescibacteria group bacterium]